MVDIKYNVRVMEWVMKDMILARILDVILLDESNIAESRGLLCGVRGDVGGYVWIGCDDGLLENLEAVRFVVGPHIYCLRCRLVTRVPLSFTSRLASGRAPTKSAIRWFRSFRASKRLGSSGGLGVDGVFDVGAVWFR